MKKILIIQNKRIGDVLLSTVIADNIKKVYPKSQVDFLAYDYCTGVLDHHANIDNIISIAEKDLKGLGNLLKMARQIRKTKYDIIFDPYAKFQSRVLCLLSGAKQRIGSVKIGKSEKLGAYTHPVTLLEKATLNCGKSLEDRVHLVTSQFNIKDPIYKPKIHLEPLELSHDKVSKIDEPILVFGILGSNPKKSMPLDYVLNLVNYVTEHYKAKIVFNYAPYQKEQAKTLYERCERKDQILFDVYEENIRGFVQLMNASTLLVANEGGSVHIAKALNKPTFTIYSPYILRESWASFEDGKTHTSVHLLDHKPELFKTDRATRKNIEENPQLMYEEFKPELIIPELKAFLDYHLA
ncbi:glycosyltransferase family 9 protein [Winogradskyella maritima]|uniref:Glycosyltransferase family 9 protein n=1 Tax=Winogradskyella maritima TaxID=1517766 RepID=A0ABV8AKH6_9FLAO|nr:glycosyltransferase family 9 protein [Winogradskyella maritima]